ncbi:MAG: ATP synthase subunit C [Defluviitaleaceae bacterium]|nr:ATP synthase subunit C [Defluviitaleaceae bacterium]
MFKGKRGKRILIANVVVFTVVYLGAAIFLFTARAGATEAVSGGSEIATAAAYIAAALVTGMGAIGTGIAVSSAAAAAIAAVSENEQNFGKSMIFVAMAEGIAIYGLLVAFMILGRV